MLHNDVIIIKFYWHLPNMRRCIFVIGLYEPHPTNTTCFL